MIQLSKKQIEYTENATHRWNIKSGAVRSGKSFVDIAAVIPERIITRRGKHGLVVIGGVTRDSIERNVLAPMREIYGHRVGSIRPSTNTVEMFGEQVYCFGAEKVSQVSKIQGSSIKYCYGDEIARWNEDFFEMLKSRLDKPYSCFDGACNPEYPTHWLKKFIESDVDIYLQHWRIFDNPYLSSDFVRNLCEEYAGTVYYDRLIEGLWKRAEGAIYRAFADSPEAFKLSSDDFLLRTGVKGKRVVKIVVGVDFGGNQSGHAFVATAFTQDGKVIPVLSRRVMAEDFGRPIDSGAIDKLVCDFVRETIEKYGRADELYWDNAETVLGNTIKNSVGAEFRQVAVRPARKVRIKDRIDATIRLMGAGRFYLTEDCKSLAEALSEAIWNDKREDERLDDGTSDIDSLDAFEYTFERDMRYLIEG